MRSRWLWLGIVALLALALGLLLAQATGRAQTPLTDLVVTKSVQPALIAPGHLVAYAVMLTNTTEVTIALSSLVDTLPDSFVYGGLAWNSEWTEEPWDADPPVIQWAGPITVPASDSLLVRYWVFVPHGTPLSPDPYTNTVVATWMDAPYEAEAGVLVAVGEVSVAKTASPARVGPGELVTYTVAFSNTGYAPAPLVELTDLSPPGVTFVQMTAGSDVATPPLGTTGTLTWTGPFTIPSHADLVFQYQSTMPLITETLRLENLARGDLGAGMVITDSAEVEVTTSTSVPVHLPFLARNFASPRLTATKSAEPPVIQTGQGEKAVVTYTVTFENVGTALYPAIVERIDDTLPTGFTFLSMASGSDVQDNPVGTSGTIAWQGPFEIPSGATLRLIYRVETGGQWDEFANSVMPVMQVGEPPPGPASATVTVRSKSWLDQDFESNNEDWEPFLNYWRLHPEQWFRENGYMKHVYYLGTTDPLRGAHDALYMYRGADSETWTDYSYEARVNLVSGAQIGVWFRGTYDGSTDGSGQKVTGYYFLVIPSTPQVRLATLRTEEECYDDCAASHIYHFSNPYIVAEVRGYDALAARGIYLRRNYWHTVRVEVLGNRIKCYVDGQLAIDYLDDVGTQFLSGTVGFFTYKAADARFDDVKIRPLP